MTHATVIATARIGPNAVIRVAEALLARGGSAAQRAVFHRAGLHAYLRQPPAAMIDEREVRQLHRALHDELGAGAANEVACEAGRRTADYLLAHRIPRIAQSVLRRLPAPLAARLLLSAVQRHAWTFAGSGRFAVERVEARGARARFAIADNPLCIEATGPQPACAFYAATFERLFRVLVHAGTRVDEVACSAHGAPACLFEAHWPR
jgi:divinyl protochlorophyllide a 8-vinyl-reductase